MTIEILTRDPVTGLQSVKTLANIILTAVKVAGYTAAPNEVVQASQVAAFTVTAPPTPEDGTLFGVAIVESSQRKRITIDGNGEVFSSVYEDRAQIFLQGPQTLIFKFASAEGWVPVYSVHVTDPNNNVDASFNVTTVGAGPFVTLSYDTLNDGASIRWKVIADCHDNDAGNDDTAVFELMASFFRDEVSAVTERHVRVQVDDRDTGLQSPNVDIDFNISSQTIECRLTGQSGKTLHWKVKIEVQEYEDTAA